MTDLGEFTATAAAMVRHNDRRAWLRGLNRAIRRAAERAGLLWSAVALAAVLLAFVLPTAAPSTLIGERP